MGTKNEPSLLRMTEEELLHRVIEKITESGNVLVQISGDSLPEVLTYNPKKKEFHIALHSLPDSSLSGRPITYELAGRVIGGESGLREVLRKSKTLSELNPPMPEAIATLASNPDTANQGSEAILRELYARKLIRALGRTGEMKAPYMSSWPGKSIRLNHYRLTSVGSSSV